MEAILHDQINMTELWFKYDQNFFTMMNVDMVRCCHNIYPQFEVPYPQLKRGQQTLGTLVAVVRSYRYIYNIFSVTF